MYHAGVGGTAERARQRGGRARGAGAHARESPQPSGAKPRSLRRAWRLFWGFGCAQSRTFCPSGRLAMAWVRERNPGVVAGCPRRGGRVWCARARAPGPAARRWRSRGRCARARARAPPRWRPRRSLQWHASLRRSRRSQEWLARARATPESCFGFFFLFAVSAPQTPDRRLDRRRSALRGAFPFTALKQTRFSAEGGLSSV